MKRITKIATTILAASTVGVGALAAVASAAPTLPAEQQALLNAGYTETASWGKFDNQHGACHITVELSGKNYYVFTRGTLSATLYPVRPGHVVDGAALLDANCQG